MPPVPFARIIAPTPTRLQVRRMRAGRRRFTLLTAASILLAALSALMLATPMLGRLAYAHAESGLVAQVDEDAGGLDRATRNRMLAAARDYNTHVADGGQVIGETLDPFGNPDGDFSGSDDTAYTRTLDMGDGIMGTLSIPRIGVDLTIRHGSSDTVLQEGLGHLHGTSLPVGGKGTHAALTGHRGMPDRLMLTRLDEMREGDPFYLHILGDTLAYRVVDIRVVDPDDTGALAVQPGRDLVTLVTCTPYGINTQRLLVTGERASMPDVAPYQEDAPGDARTPTVMAAGATGGAGLLAARTAGRAQPAARHRRGRRRRH